MQAVFRILFRCFGVAGQLETWLIPSVGCYLKRENTKAGLYGFLSSVSCCKGVWVRNCIARCSCSRFLRARAGTLSILFSLPSLVDSFLLQSGDGGNKVLEHLVVLCSFLPFIQLLGRATNMNKEQRSIKQQRTQRSIKQIDNSKDKVTRLIQTNARTHNLK